MGKVSENLLPPTSTAKDIVITKTAIIAALEELKIYEEGFRFQALGVILAKSKCNELKASEPKSDLGLDAYAPGELFENGFGRGAACSNTASLTKIREDIEEAQKHFTDLGILFFATPCPVSEKKAKGWREKIKKDYGITLIVISREEIISELLRPDNASLCSSILRIPTSIEPALEQMANDCRSAAIEINTSWAPQIPGVPLIELSADQLGNQGNQIASILELKDIQEMLLQSRRVMLEAPAGRGKTTTLTQIAEKCVASNNLAFIIDLPSWTQKGEDILEFLAGMRQFKGKSINASQLAKLYDSQHFVFLLNGWNEIAEGDMQRAQTALSLLERQYPKAGILVSTRTHRVKPPLPGTTVRAKLRLLNSKQRTGYVIARLGEQAPSVLRRLHSEPVLDDLTLTPLFMAEVISIAEAGREIPTTKMGVLREVMNLQAGNPTHHVPLEGAPLSGKAAVYLTSLAYTMTANGQTQLSDSEARIVENETLRRMRESGEADTNATAVQVIDALVEHHVIERIEYPTITYRFEHQQIQEYYAAEHVKRELVELIAKHRGNALDTIASTVEAKNFQLNYSNQSSWSEPLSMVAGDLDIGPSNVPNEDFVEARALSVLLALDVDLIFASELFHLCGTEAQALVSEKLSHAIRGRWDSPDASSRSQALTAMIATGSDLFKEELLPYIKGTKQDHWFEVYRSASAFNISSLGSEWQKEVGAWDENSRSRFVSEMLHTAGPSAELASFALNDPSVEVRARAVSDLMWMNTDDEVTQMLLKVDEPAFEKAIENLSAIDIHSIFRSRALKVYRRVLTESPDQTHQLAAASNAVLMGQLDIHPTLKRCLDGCSVEVVRQMDRRDLRPLLMALTSDDKWRSDWIIRRVFEGALDPDQWSDLVDPIDANLKETLLQRLETENLSKNRVPGVRALLRLNADSLVAQRIFTRLIQVQQDITEAISMRSEANLERARELGEVKRQLEDFLRKLPPQTTVDGVLAILQQEFRLQELSVLVELWDWGMDNDADLHEVLTETSRQAVRHYLIDAVARLSNENDPGGSVRAHLAVALSRVADPEDIAQVSLLLESEIARIRVARVARANRETGALANGSQMRYTNRYMLAVRQLHSESEGTYLAKLLAEPEYEGDVAWALVEWAMERSLPANVWIDGWANRTRQFREIWEARLSSDQKRFDEHRRMEAVRYLRLHVDSLLSTLSADTPDQQVVWRLKDLMKALATLDSKVSGPRILDILALPLKTHGTMDGWKRILPLEIMLFEGATLPNNEVLSIIMPVIDELNSKWHSDNERAIFSKSFGIMPFLVDSFAGIAVLAEQLDRTRLSYEGLSTVVLALGHSRCDAAIDLLVAIASKDNQASNLGHVWINALAELDTPRAHGILLSFIDPASLESTGTLKTGRDDILALRIAELSSRKASIRSRVLELCHASLDKRQRNLLASVIVRMGDDDSLTASLYLLDDQLSPELPYDLSKAIEKAFVEHRPTSDTSNSYTLHPRPANHLRDRLIEMARSDSKRKASALSLLFTIESWRLEYGRPAGETRNPVFGAL
jgi:hypothetical protein